MIRPYPHIYTAAAGARPEGAVGLTSTDLPEIATASPPEFGGPGGVWSPETLLCASVADCFILTFRAVSRAAKFDWLSLECRVEGILERVDGLAQFTRFASHVTLTVPRGTDAAQARALLERAEKGCLVANSLRGARTLEVELREQSAG